MPKRIQLLNQWAVWTNGALRAIYSAVISSVLSAIVAITGELSWKGAAWTVAISTLTRVLQYLMSHQPPDVFAVDTGELPTEPPENRP